MKKLWLKFKKWIIAILGIGTITIVITLSGTTDTISLDKVATLYNQATDIKSKYVLSEVSLIKTDIKNAELDKYKNEPKDEIKVTIGDNEPIPVGYFGAGEQEFKPNIELKRWNEVSFKIKTDNLLKDVATKDKKLSFDKDKIKFDTPKISFEMYSVDEGEGSYKFIWYLNEKPATNKVEFDIESSGLDFFYQPPLNAENTDPNLTCTETQCKDADGNVVMERPENVVGSYAVYHSTKGGMNDINGKEYKTGKAFHIYRPHIIDANGAETWGILHIENGIYSVEIPQEFLDTAVYPIKSNDTFGYTSDGGSEYAAGTDGLLGMKGTGASGTGVSIGSYVRVLFGSGNIKGVLVESSGKTIVSNGVGGAVSVNNTTRALKTSNFSTGPTITAQDYYASWVTDNFYMAIGWDDGAGLGTILEDVTNSYSTPTNPTDGMTSTDARLSIYATYTPAGGGAAVVEDPPSIIISD